MKNKLTVLLCVVLAAAALLGACAPKKTQEEAKPGAASDIGNDIVVVTVNGEPIYYGEYYRRFSSMAQQYGISEDDEQNSADLKEGVLESLINEKVLKQKLTELGYFTQDQKSKAQSDAQADLDMWIESFYAAQLEAELGENYTEEEYAKAKAKYENQIFELIGFTKEEFIGFFELEAAEEAAKKALMEGIEPSDEQVRQKYDEYIAGDKEVFDEDPGMYVSDVLNGSPVYYAPEGVRMVRHILISIDSDAQSEITTARQQGDDEKADALLETALSKIQEKSDEILKKINDKEISFEEAIKEYSEDSGQTDEGYPMAQGTTTYMEGFTTGAMELESVGQVSKLIATDYGYHIIEYFKDVEAGAVDYEAVKEELYQTLFSTLQDEKWNELVEEWINAAEIVYSQEKY